MGIELVTERRTRGGMFYDVRCFGYAVRTKCTGRKTEERRTKINGSWKLMRPKWKARSSYYVNSYISCLYEAISSISITPDGLIIPAAVLKSYSALIRSWNCR